MPNPCPWPLIFAYDRAADTLHSTVIGGVKVLVAFADLGYFQHWRGKAAPLIEEDPSRLLPVLLMLATDGGNKKLAVMYHDPPDKWRVDQFDLGGVISLLAKAAG
jgi:hypothetical protein